MGFSKISKNDSKSDEEMTKFSRGFCDCLFDVHFSSFLNR